jgi:transcription elongation factor Elf1
MRAPDAPQSGQSADRCPRCGAPDVVLKLLTSMTRYFACGRCGSMWEISITASRTQVGR